MLVLILGTSDFGGGAGACGSSSFSESLPPELSIDTSVSIPTWSHPKTDLDLVASCFAFAGAFGGIGCEIDFLGSNSSGSSSGESSKSSLSLFSVKFTLILQDWKRIVVSQSRMMLMTKRNVFDYEGVAGKDNVELSPDHFLLSRLALVLRIVHVHRADWRRHDSPACLKLRPPSTHWQSSTRRWWNFWTVGVFGWSIRGNCRSFVELEKRESLR